MVCLNVRVEFVYGAPVEEGRALANIVFDEVVGTGPEAHRYTVTSVEGTLGGACVNKVVFVLKEDVYNESSRREGNEFFGLAEAIGGARMRRGDEGRGSWVRLSGEKIRVVVERVAGVGELGQEPYDGEF